jgi:hypothetical protein
MDPRSTSQERIRSSIFLGAMSLLNGLVSVAKMLMAGVIVAILLTSMMILYTLSDVNLSPFINEKSQPQ